MQTASESPAQQVRELRAAIEVLETEREELQSRNEELKTVNVELAMRVEETAKANDDLSNLVAATDIATLFLDCELCIKRYTPHASGIFNVIPTDIGRPLHHITNKLDYPDLTNDLAEVLKTLTPLEREVRSRLGQHYIVRVHPYRTADDRIEGVVMTLFDITLRRRAEDARGQSEARVAAELSRTKLLQRLSTMLIPEQRPGSSQELILDAAIELMNADAVTIQLLESDGEHLVLIASRNIHPLSQDFWRRAHAHKACAGLPGQNQRVVVEDTEAAPELVGTPELEEYRRCGIRAGQITPLKSRSGRSIGLISTWWKAPHRLGDDDFNLFDVLARQLADLVERSQTEEAVRNTEAQHRAELERQVRERTAELKHSRDLLKATMDASMDMIQVFEAVRDDSGQIIDFKWLLNNHTSESQYGEVLGQSLLQRNPGVVVEGIFDTFKQVVETGLAHQAERHYVHEQFNGWFLQSVVKLGDGVATTTKDITEWTRAKSENPQIPD